MESTFWRWRKKYIIWLATWNCSYVQGKWLDYKQNKVTLHHTRSIRLLVLTCGDETCDCKKVMQDRLHITSVN